MAGIGTTVVGMAGVSMARIETADWFVCGWSLVCGIRVGWFATTNRGGNTGKEMAAVKEAKLEGEHNDVGEAIIQEYWTVI